MSDAMNQERTRLQQQIVNEALTHHASLGVGAADALTDALIQALRQLDEAWILKALTSAKHPIEARRRVAEYLMPDRFERLAPKLK
ncbi:MAG: hypothetical protein IT381_01365 [Deltaproteobacteria bacterium]|nr:hypothetical protein [Deltaproteobacteria bacterium]